MTEQKTQTIDPYEGALGADEISESILRHDERQAIAHSDRQLKLRKAEKRFKREKAKAIERRADSILPKAAVLAAIGALALIGGHRLSAGAESAGSKVVSTLIGEDEASNKPNIVLHNVNGVPGATETIPWDAGTPGQQDSAYYEKYHRFPSDTPNLSR